MTSKKLLLIIGLLSGIGLLRLQAQYGTAASGGNASGIGGTLSYTAGQIVYTVNTGTGGAVSQGVQQPYEISLITSTEKPLGAELQCSVYPNPTMDYIEVKVENYSNSDLYYQLFDSNGKFFGTKEFIGNQARIDMRTLVATTYLLTIKEKSGAIKIFKIIKH